MAHSHHDRASAKNMNVDAYIQNIARNWHDLLYENATIEHQKDGVITFKLDKNASVSTLYKNGHFEYIAIDIANLDYYETFTKVLDVYSCGHNVRLIGALAKIVEKKTLHILGMPNMSEFASAISDSFATST